MDKKKGLLNVSVAIAFRIVILITNILARRYIIRYICNEINGLNSLYLSILDVLSVVELGVGTAITYCMYAPIVKGENDKVSALYHLFTKLYFIIGGIISVAGCAVMPALPYIAKDYQSVDVNLYLTFGLMLISVVITYAFSSKMSLINAYKNNYITTAITSVAKIIEYGLQIVLLIVTHSFIWYLICRIISSVFQWILTEIIARYKYGYIISSKQKINVEERKEVAKNIKAMFMHKIGAALVNTADSIIISAFIGIAILGKYSNYTTIVTAMISVITLCFTPLTSVIGHMYVEESKEQTKKYFNFFHTFNYILGTIFFLGYYAVIDNLVTLLFGDNLEIINTISLVITINSFIQFMEQSVRLFKDASGMFYYDRWKCIYEGILNVSLSIFFVCIFPEQYKVVGVIVATIITNLSICHVVEPLVLYKHTFQTSPKEYFTRNYLYIALFVGILFALHFTMIESDNQWIELLANGGISLTFSLPISLLVGLSNKDFRHYVKMLISKVCKRKNSDIEENA